jgi:hypothetical protein
MGKRRRIAQAVRDDGALAAQYYQNITKTLPKHYNTRKDIKQRFTGVQLRCQGLGAIESHFEVQVSLMRCGAAALTLQEHVNFLGFLKHKSSG